MNDRIEITATIPANVGKQATRAALLAIKVDGIHAALKAKRDFRTERIRATDEWNEADGLNREMLKATAETRKEIAALKRAAALAVAATKDAQDVETLADALKMARVHLADELRESRQMLLPFARECGVEL